MKRKDKIAHPPARREGGPMVAESKTPGGLFRDPAGSGPSGPRQFVCFQLNRHDYALPLENVDRALRMVAVTPVPETPDWMAGVINLHGRIIPVVDLRKRFGFLPKAIHPDDRLLVTESGNRIAALVVDEVTEVIETPTGQIAPPTPPRAGARPFLGMIRQEKRLILILDPDRLPAPEIAGENS